MWKSGDDDEDDLEALRLSALATLKAKKPPLTAMPPCPPPTYYAQPRPRPNNIFHRHQNNSNLIAIVPISDDFVPPIKPVLTSKPVPVAPTLILPQDRYCKTDVKQALPVEDDTKVTTKFNRYDKSSSSEDSDQSESDAEASEDDDPDVLLVNDDDENSLDLLMSQLDDEINQTETKNSAPARAASPKRESPPLRRLDSPPNRRLSPNRRSSPPRRQNSPPARRQNSPNRRLSPMRRLNSPPRRLNSPNRRVSPSRRLGSPLRRVNSPPRRLTSPPRRLNSPHRRQISPPRRLSSPPRRPRSPKRSRSSSRTRSPRRRSRSPLRGRSPLRNRSPVRARSPLRLRSPVRGRSRSPIRGRSRSPVRGRSRSPIRGRSRSPDSRNQSPNRQRQRRPAGNVSSPARRNAGSPWRGVHRSSPMRNASPSARGASLSLSPEPDKDRVKKEPLRLAADKAAGRGHGQRANGKPARKRGAEKAEIWSDESEDGEGRFDKKVASGESRVGVPSFTGLLEAKNPAKPTKIKPLLTKQQVSNIREKARNAGAISTAPTKPSWKPVTNEVAARPQPTGDKPPRLLLTGDKPIRLGSTVEKTRIRKANDEPAGDKPAAVESTNENAAGNEPAGAKAGGEESTNGANASESDLRTELKRRRAERMSKLGPASTEPGSRLVQSAILDLVGKKQKKRLQAKREARSEERRVIVINRDGEKKPASPGDSETKAPEKPTIHSRLGKPIGKKIKLKRSKQAV